jgi:hypothetical protein
LKLSVDILGRVKRVVMMMMMMMMMMMLRFVVIILVEDRGIEIIYT